MALKKSKSESVTKDKKVIKSRLKPIKRNVPEFDVKKQAIVDAVMADVAESNEVDEVEFDEAELDEFDGEVEFDEVETKVKPKPNVGKSKAPVPDIEEVEFESGKDYSISDMVSKKLQDVGGEKVYYNVQLRLPGYCEDLYKSIPPALRKSLREIFIESLREMYDQTRSMK